MSSVDDKELFGYQNFLYELCSAKDMRSVLKANPVMAAQLKKDLKLDPNLSEVGIEAYIVKEQQAFSTFGLDYKYSTFGQVRRSVFLRSYDSATGGGDEHSMFTGTAEAKARDRDWFRR